MVEQRYLALRVLRGRMDHGMRGRIHVEITPDGVLAFRSLTEARWCDGRWHEQDDGAMLLRHQKRRAAEPWSRVEGWHDQPRVRELAAIWSEWGGEVAPPAVLDRVRAITEVWVEPRPRPSRALVVACSATKDPAPHHLCARYRYRGPLWLTLNKLDTE